MRGTNSACLAAIMLAGCQAEGRYPEQCGARLAGWKKPDDGYGVLVVANRIHVLRDGTLKWNGETVTPDELRRYSGMLPEMNPIPFTILEIEEGASCSQVQNIRTLINEQAKCKELEHCGEGSGPWSIIGDVIGPDGRPVIVGTEDDFREERRRVETNRL